MGDFFTKIAELFNNPVYLNALLRGLGLTLQISIAAALTGLIIGTAVALIGILKPTPGSKS